MTDIYFRVASILMDLRAELSRLGLWQNDAPSPEALASDQPFCVDTLDFNQWLQFIFLPRMHAMLDQQASLPTQCGIAPMAEEFFRGRKLNGAQLLALLAQLDAELTGQ